MKKNATAYCAGPAYYRMCSTDVYCSKQTGSSSTKGEKPSPIISSFLELKVKKTVDAAKICMGAENVVKNRNPANIRKWIARFYYFRHFIFAGSACVLLYTLHERSIDMGNSICTLLINILRSFQLFLHSDQPSEGEIILFSGVCQSGEAVLSSRRRRWWFHALTDRLL